MDQLSMIFLKHCTDQKELGLAAPQIGKSIRLFLLMATRLKTEPELADLYFINAHITGKYGDPQLMNEAA